MADVASVLAWMKEILPGQPWSDEPLQQQLKSGVALCSLLNALKPGSCKAPSSSAVRRAPVAPHHV
eukprot:5903384-Prymnesium_polylepis.2